jgi:hypothetical protein
MFVPHAPFALVFVLGMLVPARLNGAQALAAAPAGAASSHGALENPNGAPASSSGAFRGDVAPPSTRWTTWTEGDLIRVDVPDNWHELLVPGGVTFAPDGAFGNVGATSVFTHGIGIGLATDEGHDLPLATSDFINARLFGGGGGSRVFTYQQAAIGTAPAIHTTVTSMSPVTGGLQQAEVFTSALDDRTFLYVVAIRPAGADAAYATAFRQIVGSITMLDSSARPGTPIAAPLR